LTSAPVGAGLGVDCAALPVPGFAAVVAEPALFADHTQPKQGGSEPVVNISYDEARSYAQAHGGRLLRSDEWDAAVVTPGVMVADGLYEWVEAAEAKRVVRQHGKTLPRPDTGQNDVTFRVARDP